MKSTVNKSAQEKFDSRVTKGKGRGACWEFSGRSTAGYGIAKENGRPRLAHRLAYELATGQKLNDPSQCVMHLCDNPACVRISVGKDGNILPSSHLRLGTRKDNTADMIAKGRHKTPRKPRKPLTPTERALIIKRREAGESVYAIAKSFSRHQGHIHQILKTEEKRKANKKAELVSILSGWHAQVKADIELIGKAA